MTVVAVRDGIMAADSLMTAGDTKYSQVQKIFRLPNKALVGVAGDTANAMRAVERLAKVTRRRLPRAEDLAGCKGVDMLYLNTEGVWCLSCGADGPGVIKLEGDFFAEGTGLTAALAAMYMGADAKTACEVACDVDRNCALPVQVEHLCPPTS